MATNGLSVDKSEEEWRAVLSPEQFHILRDKGTELVSDVLLLNITVLVT